MLQDLPDIFIDNVLSIVDDKTVINVALSCKNIYNNFKYVIDNRKEIKETALKNGERYKKIISFYENTMKKDQIEIIISLSDEKYQKEITEWYSLLQKNDIIYNSIYTYNFKDFSGYLEIQDKCGIFNNFVAYYYYELLVNNKKIKFIIPSCILIPPRTDILI
jgi:hypothetical protein